MKILRCSDVTNQPCDYVAEGDSTEDIKDDMLDHFAQEHRSLWDMTPKAERSAMARQMDKLMSEGEADIAPNED